LADKDNAIKPYYKVVKNPFKVGYSTLQYGVSNGAIRIFLRVTYQKLLTKYLVHMSHTMKKKNLLSLILRHYRTS